MATTFRTLVNRAGWTRGAAGAAVRGPALASRVLRAPAARPVARRQLAFTPTGNRLAGVPDMVTERESTQPRPPTDTSSGASKFAYPLRQGKLVPFTPFNFADVETAFASKTTLELCRAWLVFNLSAIGPLVRHSRRLLAWSERLVGTTVTRAVLRATFFGHFCAGESGEDIRPAVARLQDAGVGTILDYAAEADVEETPDSASSDQRAAYQERAYDANADLILDCIETASRNPKGAFAACKVTALTDPALLDTITRSLQASGSMATGDAAHLLEDATITATLSEKDRWRLHRLLARMDRLGSAALAQRVRLLVDAEQTYLQPAIDHVVARLQQRYNRSFPAVFQTYQCYLRDSQDRIRADLRRCKEGGYYFAAKLVRGAYMFQERALAVKQGRPDPIQPTVDATHMSYDEAALLIMEATEQPREVMVATHNERSVQLVAEHMARLGLPVSADSGVYFGQLLGMCDHVTYTLAARGYAAFKYVPYGPMDEVLPYLIRRAEENSSVMAGATKERQLIRRELWRRLTRALPTSSVPAQVHRA